MNKYKIVAICGKAGSGKDSVLDQVLNLKPSWHKIINSTTRPRRDKEEDGVNYYFESSEDFAMKLLNNEMIEATFFNDWAYGTTYKGLNKKEINIGIFNPESIDIITESPEVEVIGIFYIFATPKTRLLRQLNREDNPDVDEIIRRYQADQNDFNGIDKDWIKLENNADGEQLKIALSIIEYISSRLGSTD